MNIVPSIVVPKEPGYYIAFFTFAPELIKIVETADGDLRNMNGASTHYTRWNCLWSQKLTFDKIPCDYKE